MNKQLANNILKNTAIVLTFFAFDRLTKFLILRTSGSIKISSFLSFDLTLNRGFAWGIFHTDSMLGFTIVTAVVILMIGVILWHSYRPSFWSNSLAVKHLIFADRIFLAGAISNLYDRLFYSGVIDFIHFHIGEVSFPVFNLADIYIVVGVLWLWFYTLNKNV